jgi:hypothetical protein
MRRLRYIAPMECGLPLKSDGPLFRSQRERIQINRGEQERVAIIRFAFIPLAIVVMWLTGECGDPDRGPS